MARDTSKRLTQLGYRRQHGSVDLLPKPIADSRGDYGQPHKAQTLFERLSARGVSDAMALAGVAFNRVYRLAALDGLRAADWGREIRYQGADWSHVNAAARRLRDEALDALGWDATGSITRSCAQNVLGEEMSLREWAILCDWNQRPLSEHVAKGVLIGVLGVLDGFFARRKKVLDSLPD